VEAAIVLPLIILLTFALIEYGWLFLHAEQTTNAARHCARLAVRADARTTDVLSAVETLMNDAGMGDSGYSCVIVPANVAAAERGDTVSVSVTVPYENIKITGMPLPLPTSLRASVTMAKEGP
jgi:Flp pilus assembly protein TadG